MFIISELEEDRLAQCQYNVTGVGYHVYLGMILWCAGTHIQIRLESGPVTADLTTSRT